MALAAPGGENAAMVDIRAWFDADGDEVVPRPHAHAPWSDDMLHGRLLAGLVAREVESGHIEDEWFPARLTIDMFRSPPMAPVSVTTARIRDGGRVRIIDVTLSTDGCELARARVLVARASDRRAEPVWSRRPWDLAHPDELHPPPGMDAEGEAIWQFCSEPGQFINSGGPGRGWNRDLAQLVAGEDVSPFVRVATSADLSSPVANSGPAGLDYINADITLNLARLPNSDWLGYETIFHENANGISAASCVVHDLDGAVGISSVSAVLF